MKYGRLLTLVCLLLSVAGALAAHWTVNPHGFQYDMTAYVVIQTDDKILSSYDDLEIAAFYNDECRGIAKVQTGADGSTYLYMRIRSNEQQGETISFRVYQSSSRRETAIQTKYNFVAGSVWGTPGSPQSLIWNGVLSGDVTGDGFVTTDDVTALVDYILGRGTLVNEPAAYLNDDDKIDIADVAALISLIRKQ